MDATTTRNGFKVIPSADSPDLTTVTVANTAIRCWRPAAKAFIHLATFLDAVEPAREPGWEGGYAYRPVRGTVAIPSEHSAGVALDWNASQHPRGVAGEPGWTDDQVRVIRWYLDTTVMGALWRWGADFHTTPDAMHFELKSRSVWDAADGWWKQ